MFCSMSCLFCCSSCSSEATQHPDHVKLIPDLGKVTCTDMKCAYRHHRASMCLSQVFTGISPGFDLRELAAKFNGKDKVLITFASNDKSAKPDHARYLIKLFDATWQVAD